MSNIREKLFPVFEEIDRERKRQEEKWGEQNHPILNTPYTRSSLIDGKLQLKKLNDSDYCSWFSVFMEEVFEAFAKNEPEKQREEMVQVATLAVQIIEYLDRRMEAKCENEK